MGIDDRLRIDGLQGPQGNEQTPAPAGTEQTEFRRLLEKLESVARQPKTEEVEDIEKLREAMKKADDDFSAVMDLRKQLEEAYRKSQP